MSSKVSNLPQSTTIADNDLIYAVVNGVSVQMTKADFESNLNSIGVDGVISGTVAYTGTGLTFKSVQLYWRKNNQIFYSDGLERTSANANATNDRIDTFYADDSGDWNIIEGIAAPSPVKPSLTDTDTQLEVSFTTIEATATTPLDFTTTTVYDEFGTIAGGETDVTVTGGVLNSTIQAYSGTKSIYFDGLTQVKQIGLEFDTAQEGADLNTFSFWLYSSANVTPNFLVQFQGTDLTTQVGNLVTVQSGLYGFDSSIVNAWQQITIPASALNLGTSQYQKIRIKNSTASYSFFVDLVEVQDGNSGTVITPTDTSINVSQNYYSTTSYGAISDADISLGSTSFGTDNTAILQEILDLALIKPITVLWDGNYSCTGLTIHSNTHIIGSVGSGVILRNASNSSVFKNANRVLPSVVGGYGSNIVDKNIVIENLIINGNGYNTGVDGDTVFDVANNGSATKGSAQTKRNPIIDFLGAKDVSINNVKLWAGRFWSTAFTNVEQLHIRNLDIDFGEASTRDDANYDGLHFNGYARWISCDGLRVKGAKDDCLAINADAISTSYAGYEGDILDADFRNLQLYETTRGIRLMALRSRIDRITISGVKGETKDCWLLIEDPVNEKTTGVVGSVLITDVNVVVTDDTFYTSNSYIHVRNQVVENLTIKNIVRTDFTENYPLIQIVSDSTIETLSIDNLIQYSSGGTFTAPVVETYGSIRFLNISDVIHKEETNQIDAPLISIKDGTVYNVNLLNVSYSNIKNIFNKTSGSCYNMSAVRVSHRGDIEETFKTDSAIASLFLSSFNNEGNSITSGDFTAKGGDGYCYHPTTALNLPLASQYQSCSLVTDEDGGVPAYSDGVNWRRTYDKTIITTSTPIPTANLVSYQRFNNDVVDQTANHTPTSNGVTYVNGLYSGLANEAIEFDAVADWVKIPDATDLSFGNGVTDSPFSVSFVMNGANLGVMTGTTINKILLIKRNETSSATDKEYKIEASNEVSPKMLITLFDQSSGGRLIVGGNTTLLNSTDYHITITYDGGGLSSGIKIYINGVEESAYTIADDGTYTAMENLSADLQIGSWLFNTDLNYKGDLDGLGIWDIELSQLEITSIYNTQSAGTELL